eukprot:Rhum_TRINITY_DN14612_c6_g2::Rhum_TRINITY_DN14612_c6_g2_i1::g.105154::m.105154
MWDVGCEWGGGVVWRRGEAVRSSSRSRSRSRESRRLVGAPVVTVQPAAHDRVRHAGALLVVVRVEQGDGRRQRDVHRHVRGRRAVGPAGGQGVRRLPRQRRLAPRRRREERRRRGGGAVKGVVVLACPGLVALGHLRRRQVARHRHHLRVARHARTLLALRGRGRRRGGRAGCRGGRRGRSHRRRASVRALRERALLAAYVDALALQVLAVVVQEGETAGCGVAHLPPALAHAAAQRLEPLAGADVVPVVVAARAALVAHHVAAFGQERRAVRGRCGDALHRDDRAVEGEVVEDHGGLAAPERSAGDKRDAAALQRLAADLRALQHVGGAVLVNAKGEGGEGVCGLHGVHCLEGPAVAAEADGTERHKLREEANALHRSPDHRGVSVRARCAGRRTNGLEGACLAFAVVSCFAGGATGVCCVCMYVVFFVCFFCFTFVRV